MLHIFKRKCNSTEIGGKWFSCKLFWSVQTIQIARFATQQEEKDKPEKKTARKKVN